MGISALVGGWAVAGFVGRSVCSWWRVWAWLIFFFFVVGCGGGGGGCGCVCGYDGYMLQIYYFIVMRWIILF